MFKLVYIVQKLRFKLKLSIPEFESIDWPDISVCMGQIYKNKTIFENFIERATIMNFENEEKFKSVINATYYNQPGDIIQGILFGSRLKNAIKNGYEKDLDIKPPIVKSIQVDYFRSGACAVFSTKEAKKVIDQSGEIFGTGPDSDFTAVLFLKVRNCNIFLPKTFLERSRVYYSNTKC